MCETGFRFVQVRILYWVVTFSLCPYWAEGVLELCGVSYMEALIPFMLAPHDLITAQSFHL